MVRLLALIWTAWAAAAEPHDVGDYRALALEQSPATRAAFARWQAADTRVARTLPEPEVSFGYFVQAVETRTGPQQAKLSLRQVFPWPTTLTQAARSVDAQADAAERRFDATVLATVQAVDERYWALWSLRAQQTVHAEHLAVVDTLVTSLRARVETGRATLADLQQVTLQRARLDDHIRSLEARETAAEAALAAVVGLPQAGLQTGSEPPAIGLPGEVDTALVEALSSHPMVVEATSAASSSEASARAASGERGPRLAVGVDWILVGDDSLAADAGKDAVMVGLGVSLPLWQGSYGRRVASHRAEAEAARADGRHRRDALEARLRAALADVSDTARRTTLTRETLLPQAETAHASVLGTYASGGGDVAQVLLAQQALLELRLSLAETQAEHAQAWARLRALVGRDVALEAP